MHIHGLVLMNHCVVFWGTMYGDWIGFKNLASGMPHLLEWGGVYP